MTAPTARSRWQKAEEFDWEKLLEGVDLFYFSGITPAISCEIEKTLESALMLCKEKKIQVVCDLNYRGKMWSSKGRTARHAPSDVLRGCLHCK